MKIEPFVQQPISMLRTVSSIKPAYKSLSGPREVLVGMKLTVSQRVFCASKIQLWSSSSKSPVRFLSWKHDLQSIFHSNP
jgi:hypothetical protein